jgi:hypothetical protein
MSVENYLQNNHLFWIHIRMSAHLTVEDLFPAGGLWFDYMRLDDITRELLVNTEIKARREEVYNLNLEAMKTPF